MKVRYEEEYQRIQLTVTQMLLALNEKETFFTTYDLPLRCIHSDKSRLSRKNLSIYTGESCLIIGVRYAMLRFDLSVPPTRSIFWKQTDFSYQYDQEQNI